ncbi:MAG: peptide chain release factor N(5)-glutamine methyltransferase [Chloroflexota bacterium]
MTTIDQALRAAARQLSARSTSPRLDAELLLAHILLMDRAALLARPNQHISDADMSTYDDLIARRTEGEPIAYLTGHKEFYGLDLLITKDVLVPRPETESVVDVILGILPVGEISQMADIGTGSGAILVAVAANRPLLTAFGTEISPETAKVAEENTIRHGLAERVRILVGDLLDPLPNPVNTIAANLPYVSPGEASPDVATWEPNVAVFGGGLDGTNTIRRFLEQAPAYLLPGGTIVMETAYSQGVIVPRLAQAAFPNATVEVQKDLAGYDRIVIIRTP